MPAIRTFMRPDPDQLTELVNVHIAAVVPGWALPVSALLAQFEREPAQAVVDPLGDRAHDAQFGWHEIGTTRRGWRRARVADSIPAPTLHSWKCHE
jgi:hypothetical protein